MQDYKATHHDKAMMRSAQAINHYLFHEFGLDIDRDGYPLDTARVSSTWPFELQYIGTITQPNLSQTVFMFQDGETPYYVLWGDESTFYPCVGMSFQHVQWQARGTTWLRQHDPIDLATSRIGDLTIPPAVMRRAAIESLVAHARKHLFRFRILEGLFLRCIQQYVALVQDEDAHEAVVLGTTLQAQTIGFPEAAAWRRLALHIGGLLERGQLTDETSRLD